MRAPVAVGLLLATLSLIACGDDDVVPANDAGMDSGHDASNRDATVDAGNTERWIATKTTLDVWWPGVSVDPGRDNIEIYTLTHVTGACDGASETTIRVCGISLPTYTSDHNCTANQLTIPDDVWDSPNMPRFDVRVHNEIDAGETTARFATALIGIDLPNGDEDRSWPVATSSITCEAGNGAACFPDHDNDTFPGVTAHARNDGASYVGPYDDGQCTQGRGAYTYRGLTTAYELEAGAGARKWAHAEQLRLGLRTELGVGDTAGEPCGADGDMGPMRFELRAVNCQIDPRTLNAFDFSDGRYESMDYTCTPEEREFVDHALPQFHVLAAGEAPGDTMRGWYLEHGGRDIDRRMSEGTRSESITLNTADIDAGGDGEPSCAQVRAAFANE